MWPGAKEYGQPLEGGKGKNRFFPKTSRRTRDSSADNLILGLPGNSHGVYFLKSQHKQQCTRVSVSPNTCQHLLFSVLLLVFFNHGYSNGCEVPSPCAFDCISLVISDNEHFFTWLLDLI